MDTQGCRSTTPDANSLFEWSTEFTLCEPSFHNLEGHSAFVLYELSADHKERRGPVEPRADPCPRHRRRSADSAPEGAGSAELNAVVERSTTTCQRSGGLWAHPERAHGGVGYAPLKDQFGVRDLSVRGKPRQRRP